MGHSACHTAQRRSYDTKRVRQYPYGTLEYPTAPQSLRSAGSVPAAVPSRCRACARERYGDRRPLGPCASRTRRRRGRGASRPPVTSRHPSRRAAVLTRAPLCGLAYAHAAPPRHGCARSPSCAPPTPTATASSSSLSRSSRTTRESGRCARQSSGSAPRLCLLARRHRRSRWWSFSARRVS
jgi:hypothetical protein